MRMEVGVRDITGKGDFSSLSWKKIFSSIILQLTLCIFWVACSCPYQTHGLSPLVRLQPSHLPLEIRCWSLASIDAMSISKRPHRPCLLHWHFITLKYCEPKKAESFINMNFYSPIFYPASKSTAKCRKKPKETQHMETKHMVNFLKE